MGNTHFRHPSRLAEDGSHLRMTAMTPFTIRGIQAFCYRYPLTTPVVTSFSEMRDRPAVFVRVEDGDGQTGWGEVWCNFPAVALWDLFAKRAKTPLWRMLGGATGRMRVYASGINPAGCVERAEAAIRRGHRAFKLKIGFDPDNDRANLRELRRLVGGGFLAADVNQGWGIEAALQLAPPLQQFDLAWLEEPLRADRPWSEWRALQKRLAIPLAGGENIAGRESFAAALSEGVLTVVQPDAAKWGGITGCLAVARDVLASKRHYCPHFLGGGLGLLASAHLLAGSRGGGLLEVDSNDNPLRDDFCGAVADIKDGEIELPETPGLGVAPDVKAIEKYRTL
jgi:L-alanine-DL-glutamate epimerase-like enolase superfamily enzyme